MMRSAACAALLAMLLAPPAPIPALQARQPATPKPAEPPPPLPPIPMPVDREADSYAIYSALMPLGETAGEGWPHGRFLVQDVTLALVPSSQPCIPDSAEKYGMRMNPHDSIHPPAAARADFAEILDDFDHHCHDRLRLAPDHWQAAMSPVSLLTPAEQDDFRSTRYIHDPAAPADSKKTIRNPRWDDVPGLYGFSQVYFNAHHTVALVYATHWCGGLCGEGFWVALRRENGQWKQLHWNASAWIS